MCFLRIRRGMMMMMMIRDYDYVMSALWMDHL
jgi:hypothetical protein